MLSIAIYTNNYISRSIVENIKLLFSNIYDIYIFTDNIQNVTNYETAILPSMFMEFHKDILVFLDINDYIAYQDRLLSDKIYLYISDINDIPNSVDRKTLANFKNIIVNKDNKLTMVQI